MTTIVLFGGPSDERQVSVASAQNIVRTLGAPLCWFWAPEGAVHDVGVNDLLSHERPFELDFVPTRPALWPDLEQALDTLPVEEPVFVLALHGGPGEDGTVQAMMEKRGIPFTGSGAEASANAFDKGKAKAMVTGKVRVAESRIARTPAEIESIARDLLLRHERIVLKPLAGGSSRGLFFLDRNGDFVKTVADAASRRSPYILEQFISGRELTVGITDRGDGPFALPVIEIETDPGFRFDYDGKYLGHGTREICPAKISETMAQNAQATALAAHIALGCSGYSRSDLMAANDDEIYFLETNTLPGLSNRSLVPQELRESGIAFREFLETQISLSLSRAKTRDHGDAPRRLSSRA